MSKVDDALSVLSAEFDKQEEEILAAADRWVAREEKAAGASLSKRLFFEQELKLKGAGIDMDQLSGLWYSKSKRRYFASFGDWTDLDKAAREAAVREALGADTEFADETEGAPGKAGDWKSLWPATNESKSDADWVAEERTRRWNDPDDLSKLQFGDFIRDIHLQDVLTYAPLVMAQGGWMEFEPDDGGVDVYLKWADGSVRSKHPLAWVKGVDVAKAVGRYKYPKGTHPEAEFLDLAQERREKKVPPVTISLAGVKPVMDDGKHTVQLEVPIEYFEAGGGRVKGRHKVSVPYEVRGGIVTAVDPAPTERLKSELDADVIASLGWPTASELTRLFAQAKQAVAKAKRKDIVPLEGDYRAELNDAGEPWKWGYVLLRGNKAVRWNSKYSSREYALQAAKMDLERLKSDVAEYKELRAYGAEPSLRTRIAKPVYRPDPEAEEGKGEEKLAKVALEEGEKPKSAVLRKPMVFYHVTPSPAGDILREGLKRASQVQQYSPGMGEGEGGYTVDGVFLTDANKANAIKQQLEDTDPDVKASVFRVSVPAGTRVYWDHQIPEVSVIVEGDVPSSWLSLVSEAPRGGKWEDYTRSLPWEKVEKAGWSLAVQKAKSFAFDWFQEYADTDYADELAVHAVQDFMANPREIDKARNELRMMIKVYAQPNFADIYKERPEIVERRDKTVKDARALLYMLNRVPDSDIGKRYGAEPAPMPVGVEELLSELHAADGDSIQTKLHDQLARLRPFIPYEGKQYRVERQKSGPIDRVMVYLLDREKKAAAAWLRKQEEKPGPGETSETLPRKEGYEGFESPDPGTDDEEPVGDREEGVFVGLDIPDGVAEKILKDIAGKLPENAEPEPADELHVTMVYLGKGENVPDREKLEKLLKRFADKQSAAITAKIGGMGVFEQPDQRVLYAQFDAPGLQEMRHRLAKDLEVADIGPNQEEYGYTPHVTLAYLSLDAEVTDIKLKTEPFEIPSICLWWGGEHVEFPFSQPAREFPEDED